MKTSKVIGRSLDVLIGGANLAVALQDKAITDKIGHMVWEFNSDSTPAQLIRVYYAMNVGIRLLDLLYEKTTERLAALSSLAFTGLYIASVYDFASQPHNKMNWARMGLDLGTLAFNAFLVTSIYSDNQKPPSQNLPKGEGHRTTEIPEQEDTTAKYSSLTDRVKELGRKAAGLAKDKTTEYLPVIQRAATVFY